MIAQRTEVNRAVILSEAKSKNPVEISLDVATGCFDCARHDIDDGISAKTNQILQLPSEIAVNTDITSEHNLVRDLEPHRCLLLTSAGIDCPQIEIQPIKSCIAVGRLTFFDDFAVQLLDQQHSSPPRENVSSREFLSCRASSN